MNIERAKERQLPAIYNRGREAQTRRRRRKGGGEEGRRRTCLPLEFFTSASGYYLRAI
jgi:hypothetical protein